MCWWSPGPHFPFTAGFWGLRLYNVNRRSKQDPNGLKLDKWNICSAQMLLIFQDVQLREKRSWKVLNCLLNTFIVSALNLDANMPTLKWSGKLLQFWVHSIMWKITSCILSWKVSLIREGSLELNTGSFLKIHKNLLQWNYSSIPFEIQTERACAFLKNHLCVTQFCQK